MTLSPSPQNAAEIARMAIPFVKQNYGVTLDYTPGTLPRVDEVLDDLRQDQKFEDLQPLLFAIGCYVGEVLARQTKATWQKTEDLGLRAAASAPMVIRMPDGRGCNPIGMVYKRFRNGPEDSVAAFYQVMTDPGADKPAPGST